MVFAFFFQAEDGIRDIGVTGVQTCALPIYLASYGVERYSELELDGKRCFYPVGGLEVATTPQRWKDLKRKHGIATSWGVQSELLAPEECVEKSPLLDPKRIWGGFYVPSDGIAKGVRISEAMAREARTRGAKFYGETEVTRIEVENGRVKAVETSRGRIETENVLSCAGMWGPRVGRMAGRSEGTRLNSSHANFSDAVFCLKKKK